MLCIVIVISHVLLNIDGRTDEFIPNQGCGTFISLDGDFNLIGWSAFTWVILYVTFISAEMVFGKHIISEHKVVA